MSWGCVDELKGYSGTHLGNGPHPVWASSLHTLHVLCGKLSVGAGCTFHEPKN